MKVHETNHVANFHDLCPRQVSDFVRNLSQTLSWTISMHCDGLNSTRATQTGLSRTCHRLCRKHLDMSRWFTSVTFVICVGNFHLNFMVSWFVTICVRDFHDLCPRLSPQGSFGESQCNRIWAYTVHITVTMTIYQTIQHTFQKVHRKKRWASAFEPDSNKKWRRHYSAIFIATSVQTNSLSLSL